MLKVSGTYNIKAPRTTNSPNCHLSTCYRNVRNDHVDNGRVAPGCGNYLRQKRAQRKREAAGRQAQEQQRRQGRWCTAGRGGHQP